MLGLLSLQVWQIGLELNQPEALQRPVVLGNNK